MLDGGLMATRAAIPTTVALEVDYLMINCPLAHSQPCDRKSNSKKRPISKEYKTCNKVFLACRRALPRLRVIRASENFDAKRVKRPAVFLSGQIFAHLGYSRWNSCVILKR